jgi:hypothetical protein
MQQGMHTSGQKMRAMMITEIHPEALRVSHLSKAIGSWHGISQLHKSPSALSGSAVTLAHTSPSLLGLAVTSPSSLVAAHNPATHLQQPTSGSQTSYATTTCHRMVAGGKSSVEEKLFFY